VRSAKLGESESEGGSNKIRLRAGFSRGQSEKKENKHTGQNTFKSPRGWEEARVKTKREKGNLTHGKSG